jgi:hypothetical protein
MNVWQSRRSNMPLRPFSAASQGETINREPLHITLSLNMADHKRCGWCAGDPLYEKYHDTEWGVPLYDDYGIFEFLILETFQAGLSWITILRKRENFRDAFDNFDYKKIAGYSEEKIDELLQNPGIVRNKLKVRATGFKCNCLYESAGGIWKFQ